LSDPRGERAKPEGFTRSSNNRLRVVTQRWTMRNDESENLPPKVK
jgi:hypothetical protein